ncbi:uncharacterized protein LOC113337889 [Papaver somniferum]|uniref:uncharacterized protein LOC113337889 n=1 Tax=Papaver somniferum TaxID=3469 RepID=UPI000E6FE4FB|nr:uncharacterized protein LOC113337889 [Papaver somniferum]
MIMLKWLRAITSEKEAVEKDHLQQINDLKPRLSVRDSKYRILQEKLVIDVSNTKKNALRLPNEHVKKNVDEICTEYKLPLIDFDFPDVPPNDEEIKISDSEEEYEETDGDENNSDIEEQ